ncbi:MAG: PEP-CTERM sorting domain-containing protein [Chthoniobacterales bacterium]
MKKINPLLLLAVLVSMLSLSSYAQTTRTWDGDAATNNMNTASNWSGDTLPSGSNDTALWDGTVASALTLQWQTAGLGNTTTGLNLSIAATNTDTLNIGGNTTSGSLSLQAITIANGAGAFSLGDGGTDRVTFRGTNTLTNNDNDTAVIGSSVIFANGGGINNREIAFGGSGDWTVDAVLKSSGSGSFDVTKSGSGTLTLTATNTGNNGNNNAPGGNGMSALTVNAGTVVASGTGSLGGGPVAVNAGTLLVTGDNSTATGTVTVATTGTLSGTGTIGGVTSVSGELSTGNGGIGSLAFADNLSLDSNSDFVFDLTGGSSSADLADVTGDLSLGGTLSLTQLGTFTAGDKFTLFAYDGTLSGAFTNATSTITAAGGTWLVNYADTLAGLNGGSGNAYVTITAVVPEPGSFALLTGGLAVLFVRRRQTQRG